MLSPQVLSEIDQLGSVLWSGGAIRPLTALEQVTYLLFLKRLEEVDKALIHRDGKSIYGARKQCKLSHPNEIFPSHDLCEGHDISRWSLLLALENKSSLDNILAQYVFVWLRELPAILAEVGVPVNAPITRGAALMSDASFHFPSGRHDTLATVMESIDRLFPSRGTAGMVQPGAGDIYERLVLECTGAARSGTFRTPRHLSRFMTALVDPQPRERICDTAAGSGGSLVSALTHYRAREAERNGGTVRLAWDGTPRIVAAPPGSPADAATAAALNEPRDWADVPDLLAGFDRDPALIRVAWMNLLLHGDPDPRVERQDSLSADEALGEGYDLVLCRPPFSMFGDGDELGSRLQRYPIAPRSERAALFAWLALDLLKAGGRAAVALPDGVLFATQHEPLRRELVEMHEVVGVVSLPPSMFQPDATVNTSVVVFRKRGTKASQPPHERSIWFYAVEADGFSPNARREPRPLPNDLWDALEKWRDRPATSTEYVQPLIVTERWRTVDERIRKLFPERAFPADGTTLPVQLLFPELGPADEPLDADALREKVVAEQSEALTAVFRDALRKVRPTVSPRAGDDDVFGAALGDMTWKMASLQRDVDAAVTDAMDLDPGGFARHAMSVVLDRATAASRAEFENIAARAFPRPEREPAPAHVPDPRISEIVCRVAMLDGFDVLTRSRDVFPENTPLPASKCWRTPVRRFAVVPKWTSSDGKLTGSHDAEGNPRPEFLDDARIYTDASRQSVRQEYLDSGCLEANGYSLSAARYRPRADEAQEHEPPAELIRRLRAAEIALVSDLDALLAMIEEPA